MLISAALLQHSQMLCHIPNNTGCKAHWERRYCPGKRQH